MSIILDDTTAALAVRLRHEREQRGWTLADLAARSGVSRAMLSKIEREEASPTAALLGRLSGAFGLTMSQLFARPEVQPGSLLTRAADQPLWRDPDTGFTRRSLSPQGSMQEGNAALELVWGELPPGAEIAYTMASYAIIKDQQLVVISGQLAIRRDATSHILDPGDCLRWGPPMDTVFHNPGAARCRYVIALLRGTQSG